MTRCSKCGRDATTFDSSWVYEDCMSEQLLEGLPYKGAQAAWERRIDDEVQAGWDMVNSPPHYNQHHIEVIDIIETYFHDNYHLGNACKYLLRCQYKGHTEEDLQKCIWYINRFMTHDSIREVPGGQGPEA